MSWIDNLRNWEHCGYPEWFMILEFTGGALVFLLYQAFASLAWVARKNYIGRRVHSGAYWGALAVVFHMCGLLHFSHTVGLVFPKLKVLGFGYLILVPAMITLLIQALKDVTKWNKIFKGETSN